MKLIVLVKLAIVLLTLVQGKQVFNKYDSLKRRERRDTVRQVARRWPGGKVPYIYGASTGIQTKSAFISAMREIARVSCVRFVPRTYEKDYVRVITGDGCYSLIGREGGQQDLSIGKGCYRHGIAVHETMHLLGFFHEQSRLDRDRHVTVHYYNAMEGDNYIDTFSLTGENNIQSFSGGNNDARRQFKKHKSAEGDTLGETYDPDSIMHYSNNAFSKNGKATITYKNDPTKKLGQRDRLSVIDIRQLNKLYRCHPSYLKNNETNEPVKVEVDKCRDDPWASISGQCMFSSLMGMCYHSPQRMSYLCRKTCGYCRPTCIDTSQYCRLFYFYGYCLSSPTVKKRCRKTCGICRIS